MSTGARQTRIVIYNRLSFWLWKRHCQSRIVAGHGLAWRPIGAALGSSDAVSGRLWWLLPPVEREHHALSVEAHQVFVRHVLACLRVTVVANPTFLNQGGASGDA